MCWKIEAGVECLKHGYPYCEARYADIYPPCDEDRDRYITGHPLLSIVQTALKLVNK